MTFVMFHYNSILRYFSLNQHNNYTQILTSINITALSIKLAPPKWKYLYSDIRIRQFSEYKYFLIKKWSGFPDLYFNDTETDISSHFVQSAATPCLCASPSLQELPAVSCDGVTVSKPFYHYQKQKRHNQHSRTS